MYLPLGLLNWRIDVTHHQLAISNLTQVEQRDLGSRRYPLHTPTFSLTGICISLEPPAI